MLQLQKNVAIKKKLKNSNLIFRDNFPYLLFVLYIFFISIYTYFSSWIKFEFVNSSILHQYSVGVIVIKNCEKYRNASYYKVTTTITITTDIFHNLRHTAKHRQSFPTLALIGSFQLALWNCLNSKWFFILLEQSCI